MRLRLRGRLAPGVRGKAVCEEGSGALGTAGVGVAARGRAYDSGANPSTTLVPQDPAFLHIGARGDHLRDLEPLTVGNNPPASTREVAASVLLPNRRSARYALTPAALWNDTSGLNVGPDSSLTSSARLREYPHAREPGA